MSVPGEKHNRKKTLFTEGHQDSIKIFVGSWNVKFQDFSEDQFSNRTQSDKEFGNVVVARNDYDLYGQQSTTVIKDKLTMAKALSYARASSSYLDMNLSLQALSDSSSSEKSWDDTETIEPLEDWINQSYDVIILAFQELVLDNILSGIDSFLNHRSTYNYRRLESPDMRISGYGEGAIANTKSTVLAVWVKNNQIYPVGPIKFKQACKVSFGFLRGSKGAVSVSMDIFDQRICFIGCHLPASNHEDRYLASQIILKKMEENYKFKDQKKLSQQFHHIIWAGDFNSRIHGISLKAAVKLLSNLELNELLKYDEIIKFGRYQIKDLDFKEQPISFVPTYKKFEDRPRRNTSDPDWVKKHYIIYPHDKWYKAKKYREQIPSWTDRIIYWSKHGYMDKMTPIASTYKDASESHDNSPLLNSDHSPIGCEFLIKFQVED